MRLLKLKLCLVLATILAATTVHATVIVWEFEAFNPSVGGDADITATLTGAITFDTSLATIIDLSPGTDTLTQIRFADFVVGVSLVLDDAPVDFGDILSSYGGINAPPFMGIRSVDGLRLVMEFFSRYEGPPENDLFDADALAAVLMSVYSLDIWGEFPLGTTWNIDSNDFHDTKIRVYSVPEPGTLALLAIGLLGIGAARRKEA